MPLDIEEFPILLKIPGLWQGYTPDCIIQNQKTIWC